MNSTQTIKNVLDLQFIPNYIMYNHRVLVTFIKLFTMHNNKNGISVKYTYIKIALIESSSTIIIVK